MKPLEPRCEKCGEDRLLDRNRDRRGVQMVCMVCAHAWWLETQKPPEGPR